MSDYTPTTEEVFDILQGHYIGFSEDESQRWLDKVRAGVWDESVYEMDRVWGDTRPERVDYLLSLNPYRREDQK